MKVWVCTKVADAGEEPICETRVAFSENDACMKLLELDGDVVPEELLVETLKRGPFDLAKDLSFDGRHLYVEEHIVEATPMSLLRSPNERPESCTCKAGNCLAPRATWCLDVAKRAARPVIERDTERFAQLSEGRSVN